MSRPQKASRASGSTMTRVLDALRDLSRNLWWSWDHEAIALWDEAAGKLAVPAGDGPSRNPVRLLRRARPSALRALTDDASFRERILAVHGRFLHAVAPRPPDDPALRLPGPVAYFSMEFGVHESLPIYAGGLGILAGDHAKTASDLGLPLVGVGLFYHRGYFRQSIDARGRHGVTYPRAGLADLPVEPFRDRAGRELRVAVDLPGRRVALRVLRIRVGRVDLVLLDSDLPGNAPRDRSITDRLYIGDREMRIAQEVAAGIGGVRALRALGIRPCAWHMNEGHVAFLTLERIRELRAGGKPFAEAAEIVSSDCVFTTHTPVPEGNEAFALALARRYLEPTARAAGVPVDEYLALGLDRSPAGKPFLSMTVLALRLSRFRNGVSRLHGHVSRKMWKKLWPGFSAEEVPIGSVTNGIHTPTWTAPEYVGIFARRLGKDWSRRLADPGFWERADRLDDRELWETKRALKARLVGFVRGRFARQLEAQGRPAEAALRISGGALDPDAFTIGFSRRFALYKRAGLLFGDRKRARRLFNDPRRPVQIIFAGKPHPEDRRGAELFEEILAIAREPGFAGKVFLVSNYDMEVARHLVQGVDLWLNTPRRPQEASGTSGQKVSPNAGLNLSILDGWWDEGCGPKTGWAFGKPIEYAEADLQDREDREGLYRVLTREVIPLYFDRDRDGIPRRWLRLVRSSMARLVPAFSSARMLLEYGRLYYRPAAENGRGFASAGGRKAREVAAWRRRIESSWPLVHAIRTERGRGKRRGEVDLFVAGLGPADLSARLLTDSREGLPVAGRTAGEGVVRFSFPAPRRGPARLRVWPSQPALPHPSEVGLSVEIEV